MRPGYRLLFGLLVAAASGCASLRTVELTRLYFQDTMQVQEVPCESATPVTHEFDGRMYSYHFGELDVRRELRTGFLEFIAPAPLLVQEMPAKREGALRLHLTWDDTVELHVTCVLTPWKNVTRIDSLRHAHKEWAAAAFTIGPALIGLGSVATHENMLGFGIAHLVLGSIFIVTELPFLLTPDEHATLWAAPRPQ